MRSPRRVLFLAGVLVLAAAVTARGNPASDQLRARATDALYNLDTDRSLATWREATVADPQDAGAWRGLAGALIAQLAMLRGTMTVDSYLGRVTTKDVALPPAPPALASEFQNAVGRAILLGRQHVSARPSDPQAHYDLGAAVGLRATYIATIDGSIVAAFRAAREAYNEHERVLELDRARADAGLTVGTYRYLVSALSMPMRWIAYMAGFGGGRDRGIALVEGAANHPGDNQSDAMIALILLYNRERRFDDALDVLARLRGKYPRNRLFWLETGSTLLRAGRPAEAEQMLDDGLALTARDQRPRMLGEESLWYFRRGAARAALHQAGRAREDFERALRANGRKWVQGRTHLELGQLAIDTGDRAEARRHLATAAQLCDSDSDGAHAERARELLKQVSTAR
ncbi:MAG: tetratricopeptide repeat protein [Acidobacteria bacterium]|nr:tetratricopeptide repeat protein [Acidobacteriota bacterium]